MKTLKDAFISLEPLVFARDEQGGNQVVTDRFVAWYVEALPEKVAQRLRGIPDGVWAVTGSGAYKPAANHKTVSALKHSQIVRLLTYESPLAELRKTRLVLDNGSGARSRAWVSPEAEAGALLADTLVLDGYTLMATSVGGPDLDKKVIVQDAKGGTVGVIMGRKPPQEKAEAAFFALASERVVKAWTA